MKYGSVCSGIEAATAAWHPLGWEPQFFSEIEQFPCDVLAHHYPTVPNLGDMTNFKDWPDYDIDVLVGGTPCQSYSVAGLRKGLDDPRGDLMLTFGAIAAKYRPRFLVWENVPGVLSINEGRDFATFLGLITGQQISVPGGGWKNSGIIPGYKNAYGAAYVVLDAQYFGVPQRRRRVFVVGCLGDWRGAAAILFERFSLSGNPPPSRETRESITHDIAPCLTGSGRGVERGGDTRGQDPVVAVITGALLANGKAAGSATTQDAENGFLIPVLCMATGQGGAEIGDEIAPTLNCNHEAPIAAYGTMVRSVALRGRDGGATAELGDDLAGTLRAGGGGGGDKAHVLAPISFAIQAGALRENPLSGPDGVGVQKDIAYPLEARAKVQVIAFDTTQITSAANGSNPKPGDPCHPLAATAHPPAIAFDCKASGQSGFGVGEIASTMRAMGSTTSHQNGGGHLAVCVTGEVTHTLKAEGFDASEDGSGRGRGQPIIAFQTRGSNLDIGDISGTIGTNSGSAAGSAPMVQNSMAVRRLIPKECERLQGFPDNFTQVPIGKKKKPAKDGPRYKAIGNSMATPCMKHIGERIDAFIELEKSFQG